MDLLGWNKYFYATVINAPPIGRFLYLASAGLEIVKYAVHEAILLAFFVSTLAINTSHYAWIAHNDGKSTASFNTSSWECWRWPPCLMHPLPTLVGGVLEIFFWHYCDGLAYNLWSTLLVQSSHWGLPSMTSCNHVRMWWHVCRVGAVFRLSSCPNLITKILLYGALNVFYCFIYHSWCRNKHRM